MYKAIFFDIDGTLLDENYHLHSNVTQYLDKIQNLGLHIAIATGRAFNSALQYLEQLNITTPSVFCNGTVIGTKEKLEVIREIEKTTIQKIFQIKKQKSNLSFKIVLADGQVLKTDTTPWPGEEMFLKPSFTGDNIEEKVTTSVLKIVFLGNGELLQELYNILENDTYKHKVRFTRSTSYFFEIIHNDVSKSTGIQHLAKKYHWNMEDIISVGDQDNDYEMIRDCGLGVAVKPGIGKINTICDLQISAPQNSGIEELYYHLKKNML